MTKGGKTTGKGRGKQDGAESWGQVSKLASGAWRVAYIGPDGKRHPAPQGSYANKDAGRAWLRSEKALIDAGVWTPPALRAEADAKRRVETVRTYTERWLPDLERAGRAANTLSDYKTSLERRILPVLGDVPLVYLDRAAVKRWWTELDQAENPRACHKAYCTLRAMLNDAIYDEIIDVNPCRVKGAGKASRRRLVDVNQVDPTTIWRVSEAMPPYLRLAVLLAGFCGLRRGEIVALRWSSFNLDPLRPGGPIGPKGSGKLSPRGPVVQIRRQVQRGEITDVLKTDNAFRDEGIPAEFLPAVRAHLTEFCSGPGDPFVFPGRKPGTPVTFATLDRNVNEAFKACKLPAGRTDGFTLHDLRHVHLTRYAGAGATKAESVAAGGHSGGEAWEIYQHIDLDHQAEVLANVSAMIAVGRPERYGPVAS